MSLKGRFDKLESDADKDAKPRRGILARVTRRFKRRIELPGEKRQELDLDLDTNPKIKTPSESGTPNVVTEVPSVPKPESPVKQPEPILRDNRVSPVRKKSLQKTAVELEKLSERVARYEETEEQHLAKGILRGDTTYKSPAFDPEERMRELKTEAARARSRLITSVLVAGLSLVGVIWIARHISQVHDFVSSPIGYMIVGLVFTILSAVYFPNSSRGDWGERWGRRGPFDGGWW